MYVNLYEAAFALLAQRRKGWYVSGPPPCQEVQGLPPKRKPKSQGPAAVPHGSCQAGGPEGPEGPEAKSSALTGP